MMRFNRLRWFSLMAVLLAFFVVMLGAYTRLTDSGLGCPDWPGCYGHLMPVKSTATQMVFEAKKAWTEMIHRYVAGSLGLLIAGFALNALYGRYKKRPEPWVIPIGLLLLVLFQAAWRW